jgi:type IV secretion system protein VirD4
MSNTDIFKQKMHRLTYALLMVGVLLLAGLLSTQYAAFKLHYDANLGDPLWALPFPLNEIALVALFFTFALAVWLYYKQYTNLAYGLALSSGLAVMPVCLPTYNPLAFFNWYFALNDIDSTHTIWLVGGLIWAIAIIVCMGLAFALRRVSAKTKNLPDTYGSAHWATPNEVEATGLLQGDDYSIYVGAWFDPKTHRTFYLRSCGDENVFVAAPTRSGKGVGVVNPTLLSYLGCVIATDFKNELWPLTAGWRKKAGSLVFYLNLTCSDGSAARINPLLEVRQGVNEVRDVQNITDMLVNTDGRGKSDHWSNSANSLLLSTILHILYAGRDKSLSGVRNFLADPSRSEEDMLRSMLMTVHDPNGIYNWVDEATGQRVFTHPVVASGAREMLNKSEGERTSIVSSALTFLKLYRDPIIAKNTSTSDFTIEDLISNEKPATLYLVVPPSDIARVMPFMRLLLNQILNRLTEKMEFKDGKPINTNRHKMLLMMDEFPQFGRLPFFEKALAYITGYGIRTCLITQDLTQLYAEYGRDQSLLANCHVRVAYTPNTQETAESISKSLGNTTVIKHQTNYSGGRFELMLKHIQKTEHEVRRDLLTADELMRMDKHKSIIFKTGHAPIDGRKIYYYEDPIFSARSKILPPAQSDRLPTTSVWQKLPVPPPIASSNQQIALDAGDEETHDIGNDLLADDEISLDGKDMI